MSKKIIKQYELEEFDLQELPENLQELLAKTKEALKLAYAPYSGFKVGATILLESGTVVLGNNQENAAYPSGLCAERVAIFHAGANYPDQQITDIGIAARPMDSKDFVPAGPCGNCRQVLVEYQNKQEKPIAVWLLQPNDKVLRVFVNDLLPLRFDMDSLLGEVGG